MAQLVVHPVTSLPTVLPPTKNALPKISETTRKLMEPGFELFKQYVQKPENRDVLHKLHASCFDVLKARREKIGNVVFPDQQTISVMRDEVDDLVCFNLFKLKTINTFIRHTWNNEKNQHEVTEFFLQKAGIPQTNKSYHYSIRSADHLLLFIKNVANGADVEMEYRDEAEVDRQIQALKQMEGNSQKQNEVTRTDVVATAVIQNPTGLAQPTQKKETETFGIPQTLVSVPKSGETQTPIPVVHPLPTTPPVTGNVGNKDVVAPLSPKAEETETQNSVPSRPKKRSCWGFLNFFKRLFSCCFRRKT